MHAMSPVVSSRVPRSSVLQTFSRVSEASNIHALT